MDITKYKDALQKLKIGQWANCEEYKEVCNTLDELFTILEDKYTTIVTAEDCKAPKNHEEYLSKYKLVNDIFNNYRMNK